MRSTTNSSLLSSRLAAGTDYDADVVILALDRLDETLAAIRSALGQTGVLHRVTVVDQGSRPENLARFAEELAGRDDASLIALHRNHGVPGGRNIGSTQGHGRIIFGLDNDAEFAEPTTLARAVAALDAEPALAAIGCRIVLHANGVDDLSSWGYPHSLLPYAGDSFDVVTFVGAGHAIRRTAWNACGGYDDALFFCWEEFDFCLRAIQQGWRVRYCGDVVVRHKISPERRFEWSGNRWYHFVRNRLYIGRKWSGGWLPLLPRLAFYMLKGGYNHQLGQTLLASAAAVRMSAKTVPQQLSPQARRYLRNNDSAYRERVWRDIWRLLPRQSLV